MYRTISFFKTGILFAALTSLFITIGYLIGRGMGGSGYSMAFIFFIFALIMNLGSYWFSDKIALSMAHAQPLDESQSPQIYEDVRDLAQKMNLPVPKVIYMSPEMQPNAFATGRNPQHSAICITQGLLQVLDRDEVRSVLAHELGHVKNHDVLISTIAAVFAGAISSIAHIAMFAGGSDDENRNPFASLLLIILAPISATLIQLAISRSREYAADETSAEYTRKPKDLADALMKIDSSAQRIPMNVNPAFSSLYIENPLRGSGISSLFSTHPSTVNRIARLLEIERELK
jgi:heat shock protein HtpX